MDMSVAELYQALYAVLEAIDRIIEFWLSASFAIIVATFLAAPKLNKSMYGLISAVYVLMSANMFLRWWINGRKFSEMRAHLIEREEPYDLALSIAGGYLQTGVFFFGTLGTLYFVWLTYRQQSRDA